MNYYVFIPLAGFAINLLTWTYTFAQRQHSSLNVAYLLFTGYLATWSLADFILWSSIDMRLFVPLLKTTSSLGFLTNFCFLHFIYTLIPKKRDYIYHSALFIAVFITILNLSTNIYVNGYETHGWRVSNLKGNLFFQITSINIASIIYSTALLFNEYKKASQHDINTPLYQTLFASMIFIPSTFVAYILLPYFKVAHPLYLPLMVTVLQSTFIFRYVVRHNIDIAKKTMDASRHELAKLAEAKEQLSVTLSSIGDGVITTDTAGNIVLLNRVAEALTGWSQAEALGQPLTTVFQLLDATSRQPCPNPVDAARATNSQGHHVDQLLLVAKDGTERLIDANAAPIRAKDENVFGMVLVFRDTTERRRIEEELIKADKLDSIGLLAGGVAHDFNNILTAIIGNISLAKMYANREDKVFARLISAEKAALQAQGLTQQLLTISKESAPIRQVASIDTIIRDCIDVSLRGSNVICEFSVKDTLWPVEIDQGQISQVINNLIINADQAMPDGGCIDICVGNVTLDSHRIDRHVALEPGTYVKISVSDNGSGISDAHINKIFNPYFTTKHAGNGLGLFTCYSIIKKHHGQLRVESQQGVGTTFTIYLPASATQAPQRSGNQTTHYPGKGKILIMEDDATIRDVTGEMLGHLGYDVTFARDGAEAIALYGREKGTGTPFEAVVLDLTVPGGMGGKQAVKKMLKIDPQTRAIVASGYSNDPIMACYEHYGFCDRIVKPYKAEELHAVLYRVIKKPRVPAARYESAGPRVSA